MKDKIKLLMMAGLFLLNGASGAMAPGVAVPPVPPAHVHPGHVADRFDNLTADLGPIKNELRVIYGFVSRAQKNVNLVASLNNYIHLNVIPPRMQNIRLDIRDALIGAGYLVLNAAANAVTIAPGAPQITEQGMINAYNVYSINKYGISIN